jgi:hypothetical protein
MATGIDVVHHAGLIPPDADLDRAIAQYERLGFMFTPLSKLEASVSPELPPIYLGLANRTAIFERNYLEVVGATDPDIWARIPTEKRGPFNIDERLARYAGLHIMVLGTEDIEAVRDAYVAQSQPVSPIAKLQRLVDTPDGERQMQARVLFYAQRPDPEAIISVSQHLTPEYVLQPRYMQHPNGARRMTEVIICGDAPGELAQKYQRYTGHTVRCDGDLHIVDLGHTRLVVVDPDGFGKLVPGSKTPVTPGMAGFTVATSDLAAARRILSDAGVAFGEIGGRLVVPAQSACGSAVLFEEFGATR